MMKVVFGEATPAVIILLVGFVIVAVIAFAYGWEAKGLREKLEYAEIEKIEQFLAGVDYHANTISNHSAATAEGDSTKAAGIAQAYNDSLAALRAAVYERTLPLIELKMERQAREIDSLKALTGGQ